MVNYLEFMRLKTGDEIIDFMKDCKIDIVDLQEASGYRYQTVYDILKGNTPDPRARTRISLEESFNRLLKERGATQRLTVRSDKDGLYFDLTEIEEIEPGAVKRYSPEVEKLAAQIELLDDTKRENVLNLLEDIVKNLL